MWMMGCSTDNSTSSFSDSCKPRTLRPAIHHKPHLFPTSTTSSNTTSSHSWLSLSNDEEPSSILHSQSGGEQRRLELGVQGSSRWNPTPEQLRFLENLYQRGTRTPTTEQIQHITAKLRRYGKIEGKNVFYWFQNHKARERQKCRRRIEADTELLDCYLQRKDSASYLIGFEQYKDLVTTNCCIRHEEPILFSRGERVQNPSQRLRKNSLQFVEDHNIATHQQNPNIRISGNSSPATSPIYKEANSEGQAIATLQLFPLHSDATTFTPTTKNCLSNPKSSHAHHDLIPFFQFL